MPLVRIEIIKGHGVEYKKQFLQAVHDALINALSIPDDDRFQRLYELESSDFETNQEKTDRFCIIELTFFPGRSKEMKGNVIKEITRLLGQRLEIQASDIFITIIEPPLENWGIRGNQLSEVKMEYKKE
jgi:4-oxalocrotonate tautomerase family enzyme